MAARSGAAIVESDIHVTGELEVVARDAIIRGGTLTLNGEGRVNELQPGSRGLEVILEPGARIEVHRVSPGVVVTIDGERRGVQMAAADVTFESLPLAA